MIHKKGIEQDQLLLGSKELANLLCSSLSKASTSARNAASNSSLKEYSESGLEDRIDFVFVPWAGLGAERAGTASKSKPSNSSEISSNESESIAVVEVREEDASCTT
jgi:hypothetical protein